EIAQRNQVVVEVAYVLRSRYIAVAGNKCRGTVVGQKPFQRLDPIRGSGIDEIRQMLLPDQIASEYNVGIRDDHHGIAAGMSQHVTDLDLARPEKDVYGVGIDHVRQGQGFHSRLILRFWAGAEELHVFGAQPAAQVAMGQNGGAGLRKNGVSPSMVEMVVGIYHKADGQIGDLADLREQVTG